MMKTPERQWCLRNRMQVVFSQSAAINNFNYYTVGGRYDNIFTLLRDLHSSRTILMLVYHYSPNTPHDSLILHHQPHYFFYPECFLFLTLFNSFTIPSWCTLTDTLSLNPSLVPKDKNVLLSPVFKVRTLCHFHILLQLIFE